MAVRPTRPRGKRWSLCEVMTAVFTMLPVDEKHGTTVTLDKRLSEINRVFLEKIDSSDYSGTMISFSLTLPPYLSRSVSLVVVLQYPSGTLISFSHSFWYSNILHSHSQWYYDILLSLSHPYLSRSLSHIILQYTVYYYICVHILLYTTVCVLIPLYTLPPQLSRSFSLVRGTLPPCFSLA